MFYRSIGELLTDRVKAGSYLSPDKETQWCSILNPLTNYDNSGLNNIVSN